MVSIIEWLGASGVFLNILPEIARGFQLPFSQNVMSFLDYDKDKKVEAGGTLRRSRVWIVPLMMALVNEPHALKPASFIVWEKRSHTLVLVI